MRACGYRRFRASINGKVRHVSARGPHVCLPGSRSMGTSYVPKSGLGAHGEAADAVVDAHGPSAGGELDFALTGEPALASGFVFDDKLLERLQALDAAPLVVAGELR